MHDQRQDSGSQLACVRRLVECYRESPELAWGAHEILAAGDDAVLAHLSTTGDGAVLALHNFADRRVKVVTEASRLAAGTLLTDLLGEDDVTVGEEDGKVRVELEPYGYRWLRVSTPLDDPARATAD